VHLYAYALTSGFLQVLIYECNYQFIHMKIFTIFYEKKMYQTFHAIIMKMKRENGKI